MKKKFFHHLSFRNLIITQILTGKKKKHIVISCNLILSSYNWGKQQISILLYKFSMLHKWMVIMIKAIWWEIWLETSLKRKKLKILVSQLYLTLWLHGLYPSVKIPSWNPPGKNTGAGSHSLGSFWPTDQTRVFCITGRFFTVYATREAQK